MRNTNTSNPAKAFISKIERLIKVQAAAIVLTLAATIGLLNPAIAVNEPNVEVFLSIEKIESLLKKIGPPLAQDTSKALLSTKHDFVLDYKLSALLNNLPKNKSLLFFRSLFSLDKKELDLTFHLKNLNVNSKWITTKLEIFRPEVQPIYQDSKLIPKFSGQLLLEVDKIDLTLDQGQLEVDGKPIATLNNLQAISEDLEKNIWLKLPFVVLSNGQGHIQIEFGQSNLGIETLEVDYKNIELHISKAESQRKLRSKIANAILHKQESRIKKLLAQKLESSLRRLQLSHQSSQLEGPMNTGFSGRLDIPQPSTITDSFEFIWNIRPLDIDISGDFIHLSTAAHISTTSSEKLSLPQRHQTVNPDMSWSPSTGDAYFIISEKLINQVLSESYQTGLLNTYLKAQPSFQLVNAPTIKFSRNSMTENTNGTLSVMVRHQTSGKKSLLVGPSVDLSFDIEFIAVIDNGQLALSIAGFNEETMDFQHSGPQLLNSPLQILVKKQIHKEIEKIKNTIIYRSKPLLLAKFGLTSKIESIQNSCLGSLVLSLKID